MNIVYNEDCTKGMEKLPENYIDLTVTSPPYDDLREYTGFAFDWKETIKQLYRITKEGGVVVWVVADQTINGGETGTSFKQALFAKECGFNLHDTMIWVKDSCAFPEQNRYFQVFEYMFVWSKGKPKTIRLIKDKKNKWAGTNAHGTFREKNGATKQRSETWKEIQCQDYGVRFNVWDIPAEKNNKTGHPAVFPYKIAADHIRTWSNEGDLVLDCFLGSGTTRIAAYDLNRDFIGYEISEKYYDAQEKRFADYTAQTRLF